MNDLTEILTFYKEIGAEFIQKEQKSLAQDFAAVIQEIRNCSKCPLHQTRKNVVPGEGTQNPEILFIGEGPGETEDSFGRPFIGNAGQLLDKIIEKMGYSRDTVYITNIVKCRPPQNRDPHKEEVEACMPYLLRQIACLTPKVIVCLGKVALNHLLGTTHSISKVRGQKFELNGIPVIPTYHPSYILHLTAKEEISKAKWDMWNDMQVALSFVGKHSGISETRTR